MKTSIVLAATCLWTATIAFGCAAIQVGQQVQSGRNALQTGRPGDAVDYLMRAAEVNPDYELPYRTRQGVLAYLGRAYYETGRNREARSALEKALARNKNDHVAQLYLGLTLLRDGDRARGRKEIEAGLKGIHETLEYIASDNVHGIFWDPARDIRSSIEKTLAAQPEDSALITSAEQIGRNFDEEIDKARRDEGQSRAGRGGGGGGD